MRLRFVSPSSALEAAKQLATEIAGNAPLSLTGSKVVLEALAAGATQRRHAEIAAIIEGAMNSADYREGARAFLEKRKPAWTVKS